MKNHPKKWAYSWIAIVVAMANGACSMQSSNAFGHEGSGDAGTDASADASLNVDASSVISCSGDIHDPRCDPPDANAVAAALDGLRFELPCMSDFSMYDCSSGSASDSVVLGGVTGMFYNVTLRIRGVVEERRYSGGTEGLSSFWYALNASSSPNVCGSDGYNMYALTISDPPLTAYLNAGQSAIAHAWAMDYQQTVRVAAGATVSVNADSCNGIEITNLDASDHPIIFPDIMSTAYNGQFIQIDVVSVVPAP